MVPGAGEAPVTTCLWLQWMQCWVNKVIKLNYSHAYSFCSDCLLLLLMDTEHNWNEKCRINGAIWSRCPRCPAAADSGLPGMLQCYCFILKHQLRPISPARAPAASWRCQLHGGHKSRLHPHREIANPLFKHRCHKLSLAMEVEMTKHHSQLCQVNPHQHR